MIFSKLILLPFLAVSSVAAVGFEVKQTGNGAGIQVASEETANKLHSDSHRRLAVKSRGGSLRKLQSTHKSSKKYGAQFTYEQPDDEDANLGTVHGNVLKFETVDRQGICTSHMCNGRVDAVLPGYTKEGVDFLPVYLSGPDNSGSWHFRCPSILDSPSLNAHECICSDAGQICKLFGAVEDSIELIVDLDDSTTCNDGFKGAVLIECGEEKESILFQTTTKKSKSQRK